MLKTANETTFTPGEMEEIRTKVRTVMEADGLSQKAISTEAGIAYGTFTGWLAGTYAGNNDKVAGDVQIWLAARVERKRQVAQIPEAPGFQATPTATMILGMLGYAQTFKGIVVVAGASGIGKTMTAEYYQATNPSVWLATMEPCTATVYPMLAEVAEAVGVTESVATRLSRAIGRKVKGTGGLIIVDEAQHLDVKAIDQLRTLRDRYKIGIAIIGNEVVYSRIDGQGRTAQFAQIYSRCGPRKCLPGSKPGDMCALIKAWGIENKEEIRFLKAICAKPGALRVMTSTMELASMLAAAASEERSIKHIKAAYDQISSPQIPG